MTPPRAITIRLAETRDAQAIGMMSRDFVEAGLGWMLESASCAGMSSIHLELRASNDAARRFYRAMGFYETVLVPGYYRSGEGRKEGALRMLRVLRAPGPVPYTWRPPRTEDT